ncbi:MAG: hypothetical protein J6S75_03750 [Thermoguttaceae bacterium]|nr:hypothetical protein [Thermoguttaceae bacterium]
MTFPEVWQRILDLGYFPRFFLTALAAAIVVLAFGLLLFRKFPLFHRAVVRSIRVLGLTLILFLICLVLLFLGRGRFGDGFGGGAARSVPSTEAVIQRSPSAVPQPAEPTPRLLTEGEIARLRSAETLSNPSPTAIILRYDRTGDDGISPAFLAELLFTGQPVMISGDRTDQFNRALTEAILNLDDAPGDQLRLYVINADRAGSSQIDYLRSLFHERYPGIQMEFH